MSKYWKTYRKSSHFMLMKGRKMGLPSFSKDILFHLFYVLVVEGFEAIIAERIVSNETMKNTPTYMSSTILAYL